MIADYWRGDIAKEDLLQPVHERRDDTLVYGDGWDKVAQEGATWDEGDI